MAEGKRGDVLVVRRRIGFANGARREHFVVLQSDLLPSEVETVIVAPLDEDLPFYSRDPLVVRISKREAGTADPQVVLVDRLGSIHRDRFEPHRVGRLRSVSMREIERIAMIVLEL